MLNRDQIAHEYMLTLISRDNAKLYNGFQAFAVDAFNAAEAMIAEAEKRKSTERPSVVGDGWISVYEQTPPNMISVLTISNKNTVKIGSHDGLYWDFDSTSPHRQTVTHWQPLPQALK